MRAAGSPERVELVDDVARRIAGLPGGSIVAIDGVDGSGKTMFADEVAVAARRRGRVPVRASVDGFHRMASDRYRRGRRSPEGFYRDSYDYDAFVDQLLKPFSQGAPFVDAVHDVDGDHMVDRAPRTPQVDEVLIVDGIFLHRPETRAWWAFSVFLRVPFEVSIARCADRDGSDPDPASDANRRYVEGQRLYLRDCNPETRATVVIDNSDLSRPFVVEAGDPEGDGVGN